MSLIDTLHTSAYLVVEYRKSRYGANLTGSLHLVRLSQRKPTCAPNQIAVKVEIDLPAGLFREPSITARIRLDGDVAPETITAETVAGVESAIKAAGFTVRVTADEDE